LRNILNYVAYPVIDIKSKEVVNILYFIDPDVMKMRKQIVDLDRESYLHYLEEDYKQRWVEEHGDELG